MGDPSLHIKFKILPSLEQHVKPLVPDIFCWALSVVMDRLNPESLTTSGIKRITIVLTGLWKFNRPLIHIKLVPIKLHKHWKPFFPLWKIRVQVSKVALYFIGTLYNGTPAPGQSPTVIRNAKQDFFMFFHNRILEHYRSLQFWHATLTMWSEHSFPSSNKVNATSCIQNNSYQILTVFRP